MSPMELDLEPFSTAPLKSFEIKNPLTPVSDFFSLDGLGHKNPKSEEMNGSVSQLKSPRVLIDSNSPLILIPNYLEERLYVIID